MTKNVLALAVLFMTMSLPAVAQTPAEPVPGDPAAKAQQTQVSEQELRREMEQAQRNQQLLDEHARQLEKDSYGIPNPKWTEDQDKKYQEALEKLQKQQKDLEEQSRREMERSLNKRSP